MAEMRPFAAAGMVALGVAASGLRTSSNSSAEIAALLQQERSRPVTTAAVSPAAAQAGAATSAPLAIASGISQSGGRVRLISIGSPHFEFDEKSSQFKTVLFLSNTGAEKETVTFEVRSRDPKEELRTIAVASPKAITLDPNEVRGTRLTLSAPGDCAPSKSEPGPLGLDNPGASPCYPLTSLLLIANKQVKNTPDKKAGLETSQVPIVLLAPPVEAIQSEVLRRSALVSALSVLIGLALAWVKKRKPWDPVAGDPNWDLGKSWSANATLFVGLLNALITFGGLPVQTAILPRNSYQILSLLAMAMIGIGPLLYAMIQRDIVIKGQTKRAGVLAGLYATGFVVLWAAFIQFALAWLLLAELTRAHVITQAVNELLDWSLTALSIIVFVYGFLSLRLAAIDTEPGSATEAALELAPAQPPTWNLL